MHIFSINDDSGIKEFWVFFHHLKTGTEELKLAESDAIGLECEDVLLVGVRVGDDPLQSELLAQVIERVGLLCKLLKSQAVPLFVDLAIYLEEGTEAPCVVVGDERMQ